VNDETVARSSSSKRRATLNAVGIVVLILGIVGAWIVYAIGQNQSTGQVTNADGGWQDGSLAPADSKSFSHDVQMYNGAMGVLIMKWWSLCDALKRPGSLAIMIATGSVVLACGCFLAARQNNEA
jgi:hypothetical protein